MKTNNYDKIKKMIWESLTAILCLKKEYIWHYCYRVNEKRKIVVFLNEKLKTEEERDHFARIPEDDKERLKKVFPKRTCFWNNFRNYCL